ncbi:MAG: hypothetical protein H6702_18910 [Myxococcales bacterium]|nr:hypothetical protein [Myxococcales bacterium]
MADDHRFHLYPLRGDARATLPAAAWPGLAQNLAHDPSPQSLVRPCTPRDSLYMAGSLILWHLVLGVGGGLAVAGAGEPITWVVGLLLEALGVEDGPAVALWIYLALAALAMTAHGVVTLSGRGASPPPAQHGARHLPALAALAGAGDLTVRATAHASQWVIEGFARPLVITPDHLEARDRQTFERVWASAPDATPADLARLAAFIQAAPPAATPKHRHLAFYGPLALWGAAWLATFAWATPRVLAHAPGELAGYAAYALAGSLWATLFIALWALPLHRPVSAPSNGR